MYEDVFLNSLNEYAEKLGGRVVIEDNLYRVYREDKVAYENPSYEQVVVWLDFRIKFGISLLAKPKKRKRRIRCTKT